MLSDREFVRQSLELNLFFMRIAKEHCIFMEAGFTEKNYLLACEADGLKNMFDQLLMETIALSNGIVSDEVLKSGELITDLTLQAERESEYYSGIFINSNITRMEGSLHGIYNIENRELLIQVTILNQKATSAASQLAFFKERLLNDVLNCKVFTTNYPLLIDHILREARFYLRMLNKLQSREEINIAKEAAYQEAFWNRIMAEHAKFIRGLLDPVEVKLFDIANDYGKKFDELTRETLELKENLRLLPDITNRSLENTIGIRDFKKQGTEGIVNCRIRSIAYPLLGDHVVREANHYIRLLKGVKDSTPNI